MVYFGSWFRDTAHRGGGGHIASTVKKQGWMLFVLLIQAGAPAHGMGHPTLEVGPPITVTLDHHRDGGAGSHISLPSSCRQDGTWPEALASCRPVPLSADAVPVHHTRPDRCLEEADLPAAHGEDQEGARELQTLRAGCGAGRPAGPAALFLCV